LGEGAMPWRRARGPWLDNVVIIAPSPKWIATLPGRKIPDRSDFKRYGQAGQDARVQNWQTVVGESQRLADTFARWVESGEIARVAKPL
jgi:hypothetical protein